MRGIMPHSSTGSRQAADHRGSPVPVIPGLLGARGSPAEGAYVDLILGHPTPFLSTGGQVAVAHPTAEGPRVIWLNFDGYCRGEPLHRARDLIKALR